MEWPGEQTGRARFVATCQVLRRRGRPAKILRWPKPPQFYRRSTAILNLARLNGRPFNPLVVGSNPPGPTKHPAFEVDEEAYCLTGGGPPSCARNQWQPCDSQSWVPSLDGLGSGERPRVAGTRQPSFVAPIAHTPGTSSSMCDRGHTVSGWLHESAISSAMERYDSPSS
jgi:hypothetical protein